MKNLFVVTIISIAISGCSSGNQNTGESAANTAGDSVATESVSGQDSTGEFQSSTESASGLDNLRMGMTEEEVIAMVGEPTDRQPIGNDPKVTAEDWWYGENQKVRMINHYVNNVVKDVAHQKELLKQLVIAKKNKDEAEAKRIMDELTNGQK